MFDITDIVKYKGETYRVDYFKKKIYSTLHLNESYSEEDIVQYIVWECVHESYLERLSQGLPCNEKYKFVHCSKEEATHVQLYGLTYPIAPIEECVFVEKIKWPQKLIDESIDRANRYVSMGEEYSKLIEWRWE